MNTPTRRPMLLKAASLTVALLALLGFVAAATAGGKDSPSKADAGSAAVDGGVAKKPRKFFPASKSAGGFYPEDKQEPVPAPTPEPVEKPQQQNTPAQMQQR